MTGNERRRHIAGTLLPGFVGTTLPAWLAKRLRDGLGGVCIFGPNIESLRQLRALTAQIKTANPDAVVAIDEEGGDVTRLYYSEGSPFPGNAILGRINDPDRTEALAAAVGWELRRAGCNLTFAPVVDVNSNPDNPVIGVRSFGTDPQLVAAHGAAWVRGVQSTGIAASAKHFPGHGDTTQDSHLAQPVVDVGIDELRMRELVPFAAAIAAGAKTIMTSHILLPQLDAERPATLSRVILQDLLRRQLGFDGVIVSDALDMTGASGRTGIPEAAVQALAAGCDLLCIGTENTSEQLDEIEQHVLAALDQGRLDEARLTEAAGRVRALVRDIRDDQRSVRVPDQEDDSLGSVGPAEILTAFELQPAAREWLAKRHPSMSLLRLDVVANIAVGLAPWGPFAELPGSPAAPTDRGDPPVFAVNERGDTLPVDISGPLVIVGKGNHRYPWAVDLIDRLRARPDVLVVDMGWPSDDRRYADIATFGGSRLAGCALLDLLHGAGRAQ